jgi:hypothetical protein
MTSNQLNLLTNLVESFGAQIPAADKMRLDRAQFIENVKASAPDIYAKILNTITTQGLFDHLKTIYLDRAEYWAELILELIWTRQNNLENCVQTRYNYYRDYKIQRINKQLVNKSN